ncbi:MAG: phosphatase PAP2 family protein [Acidobacteriota bacterium]
MRRLRSALARLDERATLEVRRLHGPGRDRILRRVSFFGSQRFMIPGTLVVSAVLVAAGYGRLALVFGTAVLGARAVSPALKWLFRRARPNLWPALETEKSHSFPSTHSTMGAVFFAGVCAVLFHVTANPFARAGALTVSALAITAIAFSRVYLGAHWLSDVAGGVALGLGWLVLWGFLCQFVLGPAVPARHPARARLLLLEAPANRFGIRRSDVRHPADASGAAQNRHG